MHRDHMKSILFFVQIMQKSILFQKEFEVKKSKLIFI